MSIIKLFSEENKQQLYANNVISHDLDIFEPNFKPIVCLQAKSLGYKFLITQLAINDPDRAAFCLCDRGDERLTLEVIDFDILQEEIENKNDVLEIDHSFEGKYNIAIYAKVADTLGKIITDDQENEAKNLFTKFSQDDRYLDQNKNIRKFKFGIIW